MTISCCVPIATVSGCWTVADVRSVFPHYDSVYFRFDGYMLLLLPRLLLRDYFLQYDGPLVLTLTLVSSLA